MGRAKIPRKSTTIDMTAMCDVAFLLLSFFILTTRFKPAEAVPVNIPSSVAAKAAMLETDAFVVDLNYENKAFIEMSDPAIRGKVLDEVQRLKGFQLPPALKSKFLESGLVATPFASMGDLLQLSADQLKKTVLPGIPLDSTGGELKDWITAALTAYNNDTKAIHFIIKGDDNSKYPNFSNVITAFKKNDVYKYQLLTSPSGVPVGSELYKKNMKGIKQEE